MEGNQSIRKMLGCFHIFNFSMRSQAQNTLHGNQRRENKLHKAKVLSKMEIPVNIETYHVDKEHSNSNIGFLPPK